MVRAWMCVAVLLVSACGPSEPGDVAAAADGAAPAGVAAPPDESTEALLARAVAAMQAGRITRPVGDSALDLLVTLHGREPGNARVRAALMELQPYVLLAGERAIASGDLEDAERLVGALAMFNPDAVPLPRLRDGLETLGQEVALATTGVGAAVAGVAVDAEAVTAATVPAAAAVATSQVAAEPEGPAAAPPADTDTGTGTDVVATAAVPGPVPVRGAPSTVAAPSPVPVTDMPPVLIRDAVPEYPLSALRRGLSGRVRLGFTVRADGSVADVGVLAASPEGVFEQAAIAAARRWRFEPRDAPVSIERMLRFDLPRR